MKKTKKPQLKICFAASSGGHYEQLMMLKPLMNKYRSFIVTEKTPYSKPVDGVDTWYLLQVNRREADFPLKLIANAAKAIRILHREKPDVIVTTGVLAVVPLCLLQKLRGGYRIVREGQRPDGDRKISLSLCGPLLCAVAFHACVLSEGKIRWRDLLIFRILRIERRHFRGEGCRKLLIPETDCI